MTRPAPLHRPAPLPRMGRRIAAFAGLAASAGLLAFGLPRPATAQDAPMQGAAAGQASCVDLATPLWADITAAPRPAGFGWDRGYRGTAACELHVGGWLRADWTSSAPVERGDGLAVPGLGFGASGLAGVAWANDRFEVRVAPEFAVHQNSDIEIPVSRFSGPGEFSYPWRPFDWPTRYGTESVTLVGPGASGARAHFAGLSAGVDAEPFRWGPSRRYPLLLSGYGASFWRAGLRTERPLRLGGAGTLDLNLLWARLGESEWYDDDEDNDNRLMGGLMLAFAPAFLPGLEVGFMALHHQPWDDLGFGSLFDFIQSPTESTDGNVEGNAMGGLWARWIHPGSGFEVWYEWAKDDYNRDLTNLVLEPEHSSARTLGARHEIPWRDGRFALHVEATRTSDVSPAIDNPRPARQQFYIHAGSVRQGHTNRGQMLGAPIGPGGDAQFLDLRWIRGSTTAFQLERMRWNIDSYVQELDNSELGDEGYDVELVGRLIHERPFGEFVARGTFEFGARHNRLFLDGENPDRTPEWDGNVRFGVMLMWSR